MGQAVVHFEIIGQDPATLRSYYADLFGWNMQVLEEANYTLVDTGMEGGIGGGIGEAQGPNQVVFYIEVDDPQAYLDRVEKAGGTTVVPVTEIPDMVTFAQFADPQGNVIGLTKNA